MSNKLATQANVWYNGDLNIVGLVGAENTALALIHLYRRCIVTTVPPHVQDDNPPEKRCTGPCGRVLPATPEFFCRHKECKYGLNSECKICARLRVKKYDQAHPGEKNAYVKTYYQSHKEERSVYRQGHYQANKEDYYASNQNRRALTRNASGTHTPEQIQEQYARQKGKCYYCQHKVEWGKHHVDHVIPLSRGGSNDISNLVIACPTCNLSKNDRLPHEWIKGGRLL